MTNPQTVASQLIQRYNIRNVRIVNAHQNPYESRIPGAVNLDPALYKSSLGTSVFSDITFGDKINTANNQWTDNRGRIQRFQPVTFYTVLMSVSQAKKIVRTEIQGRDGTVKEYIGMDDYEVQINGVINGPNGHYPVDEVRQLKSMLDAPIPLVVTSWYLQNLGIDMLVIEDWDLDQEAGGYAYQQFSIKAISDDPIELNFL